MKLSIVYAMAHKPKLLILDEATTGLDSVVRDEMLDLFLEFIQDENCSILFSSHITSDIQKIADYVILIHQGKIISICAVRFGSLHKSRKLSGSNLSPRTDSAL